MWQYEALCDGLGLGGERWKGKLSHEVMLHTSVAFFFPFFLLSLNLIFFPSVGLNPSSASFQPHLHHAHHVFI